MTVGVDHFSTGRVKFLIWNLVKDSRSPKQLIFNRATEQELFLCHIYCPAT